jgi:alpha-galactosidase
MPTGLRGLQMQVLDAHELAADGVARSDRALLLRALCTDPLVNSIADARSMLDAIMIEARNALPSTWFQAKVSAAQG